MESLNFLRRPKRTLTDSRDPRSAYGRVATDAIQRSANAYSRPVAARGERQLWSRQRDT